MDTGRTNYICDQALKIINELKVDALYRADILHQLIDVEEMLWEIKGLTKGEQE